MHLSIHSKDMHKVFPLNVCTIFIENDMNTTSKEEYDLGCFYMEGPYTPLLVNNIMVLCLLYLPPILVKLFAIWSKNTFVVHLV